MGSTTINMTGVHVAGDFQDTAGATGNWKPDETTLAQVGATTVYSVTVSIPDGTYQYKMLNGDNWPDEETIPSEKFAVQLEAMDSDASPFIITQPEFMRRMKDMAAMSGPMGSFYANMPDEVTLTVNGNNPIYQTLLKEGNADLQKSQVRNLADLALLSQGLLKGNDLTNFINRSVDLLQNK